MVECNGEREEKREGLTRNTLVVSDRAEKNRGGRKPCRSVAVGDAKVELDVDWGHAGSTPSGRSIRATMRCWRWPHLRKRWLETVVRRWWVPVL
jgi:hypothetical protein